MLFPVSCLHCGDPVEDTAPAPLPLPGLCSVCNGKLPRRAEPLLSQHPGGSLASITLACRYQSPVTDLIWAFKFGGRPAVALPLAGLLNEVWTRIPEPPEILVPVPTHPLKRWSRGLDHTGLLAEELGRCRGLPVREHLRRRRATVAQGQLTSSALRKRNLRGAFGVRGRRQLAGRRVALIDDLLTSGATAKACAYVLGRAGVAAVHLLAVSGNPRPGSINSPAGSRP